LITKGKLEDAIEKRLIIQWSKVTKGEIRRRNQRMTDNKMVKRYKRGNKKTKSKMASTVY
jgi:hypothetical protein